MEIPVELLSEWVGDFLWPFIRISALFMVAPFFGARTVPLRIRIILALLVTLLVQPSLPFLTSIEPLSSAGLMVISQQLIIGIIMGMVLQFMFSTLVMAGQTMATTMGLGFASTVDPQSGIQVTMLGQFYLIVATLFFLLMDGHLLMINMIVVSFDAWPIGGELLTAGMFWSVVTFSSQIFIAAVLIALPTMIGVLLVNLGFGVMTRAAPQLNIFAVGFPTTMLAGFILMFLSLPILFPLLMDLFTTHFNFIQVLLN